MEIKMTPAQVFLAYMAGACLNAVVSGLCIEYIIERVVPMVTWDPIDAPLGICILTGVVIGSNITVPFLAAVLLMGALGVVP